MGQHTTIISGPGRGRRFSRKLVVAVASAAMVVPFIGATTANAAVTDPVEVVVNSADVTDAATNVNGLTFKGFGVLSANSTSSLLMDYKAQNPDAYWKMIETLFGGDNPIMNTIKIEMGNDRNTSTGPNAAVMRSSDEYPDVAREPGFQLAADALSVNPNVKVSILRWCRPTWVTSDSDYDNIYKWYKNTILAVYRQYGYMVDSVNPHINESSPNFTWTKDFANRVKTDEEGFIGAGETKDLDGNEVPAWSSDEEKSLFHQIRTVISDEVGTGSFGDDMLSDEELRDAVDIAGYHYNTADQGNNFKTLADDYDKEIWNSEAQATFSVGADRPNNTMNLASGEGNGTNNGQYDGTSGTGIGGINSPLEMANTFVKGFTSSRRTNFVYQPAIGSFYDGFQYSSKELLSARDPWSGWIQYDTGMAVLEHVSNFAKTGYENDDNTAGIWRGIPEASKSDISDGNPPGRGSGSSGSRSGATSYMTLADPTGTDFSTVIVNDSQYTKTYKIKTDLNVNGTMELWQTSGAGESGTYAANYMQPVDETTADADGYYTFTVAPWSIATATTLDKAEKNADGTLAARDGEGSRIPVSQEYTEGADQAVLDTDASGDTNGVTDDATLYADDFEYDGKTVKSYDPKTGTYITEDYIKSRGGDTGATPRYTNDTNGAFEVYKTADGNHVMRQQIGAGMAGGAWNGGDPITTIGDNRWANYKVSTDVLFEDGSGRYATLGARQQGGNNNGIGTSAAEIRIDPDGAWTLRRYGSTVASGKAGDTEGVNWKSGSNQWNNIAVQVAGDTYTAYINGVQVAQYVDSSPQATGRIQLGSGFTNVQFDNLKVETVDGYTPYYTDLIDNMHQRSWSDVSTPVLQFDENWQHLNGQGMFVYKRSISNSTAQGATMTYTFTGTGLDLIGANGGKAKLNVTVDGKQIVANASTMNSGNLGTTYELRGLPNGRHTVTIETADANSLAIDSVGVIKASATASKVDTAELEAAVEAADALEEGDYHPDTWAVFSAAREQADEAVADPSAYGLDAEGAQALIDRLEAARKNLVGKDVSPEIKDLGTVTAAAQGDELPSTITIDGKSVPVTWNDDAAETVANAGVYSLATVSGTTDEKLDENYRYRFTAQVEVLPSTNIEYFIDSGAGDTSPEYEAVKSAIPDLRNEVADQKAGDWGYGDNAVVKTGVDINDKFKTGLYQNGSTLTYTLPLDAGSYELTAGFTEWWSGENRPMKLQATWIDASGATRTVDGSQLASLGTSGKTSTGTVSFTLDAAATVTFKVLSNGGKDPVISWLAVEKQPISLGVVAAQQTGALPETVSYNGTDVAVDWNGDAITALAAADAYDTLTATGTATIDGKEQTIKATVEVIPDGLVYYIDSGTGGTDSPQYTAVKNAVSTLRNDKVDQASDGTTWGYDSTGVNIKSGTDINDKYSTGLWQSNTVQTYYLPLDAGTYTITGGYAEWWGMNRPMYHTVNVDGTELAKGTVSLSGSNTPLRESLTFTLSAPATVEYKVTNEGAGGEKPVISWLAVSQKEVADTTLLQAVVNAADALNEADYTADSWAGFASALASAKALLDNVDATQDEVDAAAVALLNAQAALVAVEPAPAEVNKSVLNAVVTAADKLDPADYTADSWTGFEAALAAAKTVQANDAATQDEVDAAAVALVEALSNLIALLDTDGLEAVVNAASTLDPADYTADSWTPFAEALAAAQDVLADAKAQNAGQGSGCTQADVDAAVVAVVEAQQALDKTEAPVDPDQPEVPVSKDQLKGAIDSATELVESDYTADSWSEFAKALAAAQSVYDDADATQAEVDAAFDALVHAQGALLAADTTGDGSDTTGDGDDTGTSDGTDDDGTGDGDADGKGTGGEDIAASLSETGSSVAAVAGIAALLLAAGVTVALRRRRA